MKYHSTLPASALLAVIFLNLLIQFDVIPAGLTMLEQLQDRFEGGFFTLIFLIILLESIVYVGFYFPGQFFAVLLVILSKPQWSDIGLLTLAMVLAATVGSLINYGLGRMYTVSKRSASAPSFRQLLIAMIHINSLAFFMLNQGANGRSASVVFWAGLLNLPYYLLLIIVTASLSQQVMLLAESTWLLAGVISLWLFVALVFDIKKAKANDGRQKAKR